VLIFLIITGPLYTSCLRPKIPFWTSITSKQDISVKSVSLLEKARNYT
jgi:hypothetical protein